MNTKIKDLKSSVKRNMNKHEWTRELDDFLMQTVIRNYFNFEVASLEINQEAKNWGLDFGAANVFTADKCRFRWSYLHLQRKMGKPIQYKAISPYASMSEGENNKENANDLNSPPVQDGSRLAQLRAKELPIQKSAPKVLPIK